MLTYIHNLGMKKFIALGFTLIIIGLLFYGIQGVGKNLQQELDDVVASATTIANLSGTILSQREKQPNGLIVSDTVITSVTAYTPKETCGDCIMASTKYVYDGAVACPRDIEFGTKVKIFDKVYTCEDRTALRYNGRYDIFMWDYYKAKEFGIKKNTEVIIYE